MKQIIILCLCLLLLTGCMAPNPTTAPSTQPGTSQPTAGTSHTTKPTESTSLPTEPPTSSTQESTPPPQFSFLLYYPNENLDGYLTAEITVSELDPEQIVQYLIEYNVLREDVRVNDIRVEGTRLDVDMNEAFLMQLYSMGTIGEAMLMGSLLRTFLSAYDCESMMITADGEIIHSGHVDYDQPMTPVD